MKAILLARLFEQAQSGHTADKAIIGNNQKLKRAVVVAQLVERSLTTPEVGHSHRQN